MKKYRLAAQSIKPIAIGMGSCVASDRITVDGMRVGYMYREEPRDNVDSGWKFFAGDESEEYTSRADQFGIYDVNTIANYDPSIVALLETSPPCAFERDGRSGEFVVVPPAGDDE